MVVKSHKGFLCGVLEDISIISTTPVSFNVKYFELPYAGYQVFWVLVLFWWRTIELLISRSAETRKRVNLPRELWITRTREH